MDHSTELHQNLQQRADGLAGQAQDALGSLSKGAEDLRTHTPKALSRAAERIEVMAQRGLERAGEFKEEARRQVGVANERTVTYIKEEPVKSMLIAAAAGATLAGLFALLTRSSRSST